MSKIQVFDPPMCCSTGVCGPGVDPALARFASDLEWLKTNGVEVVRFNLSQDPAAFVGATPVVEAMRAGEGALPMLLLDGKVVAKGEYPGREALAEIVGLALPTIDLAPQQTPSACCSPSDAAPVGLSKPGSSTKKCC